MRRASVDVTSVQVTPTRVPATPVPTVGSGRGRGETPRVRARLVVALVGLALVLAGCSSLSKPNPSTPPNNLPPADSAVQALATGLQTGKLDRVPLGSDEAAAQSDLTTIMSGMDGLLPTVKPAGLTYNGSNNTATATLDQSYLLGSHTFSFQSTASLTHTDSGWQVTWAPAIVHPQLTDSTRLRHTRDLPKRAPILGHNNVALMQQGLVFDVGIDKHVVKADQALTSASALAALVKVDPASFVSRVKNAGKDAFVVAVTMRPADVPSAIEKISGARAIASTANLAPSRDFARALLGTMGTPTPAQVAASHGDIEAGDSVGLTGLEKRYDAQLRGTPGQSISIVPRSGGASASPSSGPSATPLASDNPSTSESPSASGTPSAGGSGVIYSTPAVPGKALRITLDEGLQTKAEKVLAGAQGVASMVVLDRSSGDVLAAANSLASGSQPVATFGRYAPGSTFKIATSLALLRHGLTPSTQVECPREVTISGKKFQNYSDYPSTGYGRISLAQAVAYSCNTAFIKLSSTLAPGDLPAAAASLGFGVDYDAGFASFFGSVPAATDPVVKAADVIGQGDVLASPMAMAGLSASVAAKKTIIPTLVADTTLTPKGQPLTASEARDLQTLMEAVVTSGTGSSLKGLVTGAKTGTAEYNSGKTVKTHAWMIAWNDRYAIAVMVFDGKSGSGTAGPLIRQFLS